MREIFAFSFRMLERKAERFYRRPLGGERSAAILIGDAEDVPP